MINDDDIDVVEEQLQQLHMQITVGQKAASAKDTFLSTFIDSRKLQLLNEFITTPVNESKKIFDVKYKLDAVIDLENSLQAIIDMGDVAKLTLNQLNNEVNNES